MRTIKINDIKVKAFERKELIEKLGFTEDEAKVIMKYQKMFPELLQDGVEGFVIDSENLWNQLDKPQGRFNMWYTRKIYEKLIRNVDFITHAQACAIVNGNGGSQEKTVIKLTLEAAKHLAMMTGADDNSSPKVREKGRLVRSYFILMEKALRNYEYWTMVREPQKEGYIQLSKTLDENYKLTHEGKETPDYIYSNEANMLNRALLGDSAKNINKLLDNEDKMTREHFNTEINKTLNELETMDMALVMAGLNFESRQKTINNICNTKYINISLKIKELKEAQ